MYQVSDQSRQTVKVHIRPVAFSSNQMLLQTVQAIILGFGKEQYMFHHFLVIKISPRLTFVLYAETTAEQYIVVISLFENASLSLLLHLKFQINVKLQSYCIISRYFAPILRHISPHGAALSETYCVVYLSFCAVGLLMTMEVKNFTDFYGIVLNCIHEQL